MHLVLSLRKTVFFHVTCFYRDRSSAGARNWNAFQADIPRPWSSCVMLII